MEQLGEATSGAVGAVASVMAIFPLVSVKLRLQAQTKAIAKERQRRVSNEQTDNKSKAGEALVSKPYKGSIDCFIRTLREEGVLRLYKGLGTEVFRNYYTNFIFFYFFSWFKRVFEPRGAPRPGFLKSMLHGICAGVCVQVIMAPIDIVNTRLIVSTKKNASVRDVCSEIVNKKGWLGLWTGIEPAVVLTLNPGITNVVSNALLPSDPKQVLSPANNFLIGFISKAVASTFTYPLVIAKIALQTQASKEGESGVAHAVAVLKGILAKEGLSGMYKSFHMQLLVATLKEAVLNMIRLDLNIRIMKFFRRLAAMRKP